MANRTAYGMIFFILLMYTNAKADIYLDLTALYLLNGDVIDISGNSFDGSIIGPTVSTDGIGENQGSKNPQEG